MEADNQKDSGHGLNGSKITYKAQGPEFKPQYKKKSQS
jgi:hypothetical protein